MLLKSLGCRLNEAELEAWAHGFRRLGFRIAAGDEGADLVVINTCAVTQEASRKSRQLIRRFRQAHPEARLVLGGCLATLDNASLAGQMGADLLVDNRDKDRLPAIAAAALGFRTTPDQSESDLAQALFARGRQRAFVKIQDGCRYACTFCVTTLARGEERSRPIAEIVEEVDRQAQAGVREVLLTGVHLGGFGSDNGTNLAQLVRTLLDRTEVPRIRLGSLEPWDLPPDFWDLFDNGRLMPHLHLPMQSGSDAVLRRMARRCKTAAFLHLAEAGRAAVPGLNLTTDIIAGFPGETDHDWQQTLEFVAAVGFGDVHVFSYSPRPGTRAAELPDQIEAGVKRARCMELSELKRTLRLRVLGAQVGRRVAVLREGAPGGAPAGEIFGFTPNYLPSWTRAQQGSVPVGEIFETDIEAVSDPGETLLGARVIGLPEPRG